MEAGSSVPVLQTSSPTDCSSKPTHCQSCTPTPLSGSPEKARFWMEGAGRRHEVSPNGDSGEDTGDLSDPIEEFPTNNKPVMDNVLKDMLMSLKNSLQADVALYMHKISTDLHAVESRVEHVKTKMREFATTINNLIKVHKGREDMEWVKAKLADIEDRSRQNNMKISWGPRK